MPYISSRLGPVSGPPSRWFQGSVPTTGGAGRDNEVVANMWRQWVPGPKHGLARTVAVWGAPGPGQEQLAGMLGRCDQLRAWARTRGWELEDTPDDLRLLDLALGEAIGRARGELSGPARVVARLGPEAGLFLGTVLLATVSAARWWLWPNGHPVIRLRSGRDLDVVAMASDRVTKGAPLLADIYAAAAGPPGAG
jgi:hypothetical protein